MTAASVHTRRRPRINVPAGSFLLLLLVILLWWLAAQLSFVIPTPADTVGALVSNFGDADYRRHVEATAAAVLVAFLVAGLLGVLLGLALGLSKWVRIIFEPLVVGFNGVPKIVLYPVLLPIFSLSGSKIVMGVLFGLFPILINVAAGIRDMPAVYWKLARSVNANWWQVLTQIIVPAIRRPLLTGVRLAASLSAVGVVLAEFFSTRFGLGRVVLRAYGNGNYPDMMATILLLISVAFIVSLLLWRWERKTR
ncbi:NitT/TauT family transport system permease protein [Tamaricihabitans halophyticus]|uniref:NitT/TauT family transport system permease protein n=1 Tax=Tamaricihabitans halophyticus TaxID=1262583 RepID=A0A4R2R0S2_9PSEU|nr:ABC transporter permease subunit [Tamaricihabitans halophyticus]TCP55324.1 NitT/TauT family transport system permease protein [Tamaricihabitans halophyticus]